MDLYLDLNWSEGDAKSSPSDMVVMIYSDSPDGVSWPSWRFTEEEEDEIEVDFPSELAEHLAPGEVAILEEVGSEKLRYLFGQAIAVHSDGRQLCMTLSDIEEMVSSQWGVTPSSPTY